MAGDSLAGKILHSPDAHGLVPGMLHEIAPNVIHDVTRKDDTGHPDRAKGNLNQHKGTGETSGNPKAAHEKVPVNFGGKDVHTEAFRTQHGTAKDEDE